MNENKKKFDGIAGEEGNVICFRTTKVMQDSEGVGFLTSKQISIKWSVIDVVAGYSSVLNTIHESLHELYETLEKNGTTNERMLVLSVFMQPICAMTSHLLEAQMTHTSPMEDEGA